MEIAGSFPIRYEKMLKLGSSHLRTQLIPRNCTISDLNVRRKIVYMPSDRNGSLAFALRAVTRLTILFHRTSRAYP